LGEVVRQGVDKRPLLQIEIHQAFFPARLGAVVLP
jgi:hypothetical protein